MTGKKLLWVVQLVLLTGSSVIAQNLNADLDHLFKDVAGDPGTHFNGIMLVTDHGRIVYEKSAGYARISEKIPNTDSTTFQLASLSKIFTAVAVMQLKEKGVLQLDDSLVKFLPQFPFPAITIRQLLSHTSGLPDFEEIFGADADHALTNADIMPKLRAYRGTLAPPGTQWSYSSVGYALLALLVEKVSGLSFPSYVEKYICLPAGMHQTYVLTPYIRREDIHRAVSYVNPGPEAVALTSADSLKTDLKSPWQTITGPGLVVSSARDLIRFDEALNSQILLQQSTQTKMYTPAVLRDGSQARLAHAPIYSGLGWGIDIDHSSGTVVSHTGGSPGMSTILLRNVENRQTVIILQNTDNRAGIPLGVNALNILNHKPTLHFGPPPR